jgi:hypothetical protein
VNNNPDIASASRLDRTHAQPDHWLSHHERQQTPPA